MTEPTAQRGFPLLPSRLSRGSKATKTTDNTAAALLLAATVVAILWANSPWAQSYSTLLDTHLGFSFGAHHFEMTVKHLVNDALMTFFFFIVGLEVTREFTIGELTDRSRAAVPVVAAVAGLAIPAVVFLLFNPSGEDAHAWGVVISTDTAFLVGALAIIKPKFPARLRIFLLTLAVVDDVGALVAIAVFYSDSVQIGPLVVSVALIVALALVRYLPPGVRGPAYAVLGVALWIALYMAGIHPTLAGVAVALLIPVFTPERRPVEQGRRSDPGVPSVAQLRVREGRESLAEGVDLDQREVADHRRADGGVRDPAAVRTGERRSACWTEQSLATALRSPLTWGIVAGLVIGKFVGITGASWFMRKSGFGVLAPGLTLRRIAGGAALSGIGFTISLFIVDIAISDPGRQDQARVGVLAASIIAFALGWAIFRITDWLSPPEQVGLTLLRPVDPGATTSAAPHDAPLTLVEYGDFECPFCSRATGSIDEVRAHFGDELRYVWRHFPLERAHPRAFDAARASEAAALQGRFFEMAHELFEHQDDLEWSDIYRYAVAAGCDIEQFDQDVRVHSTKVTLRVQDDADDAEAMDLNATPTLFVNGKRLKGPWDAASLIRALDESRPGRP